MEWPSLREKPKSGEPRSGTPGKPGWRDDFVFESDARCTMSEKREVQLSVQVHESARPTRAAKSEASTLR